MSRRPPEPVQIIKSRRDTVLARVVDSVAYAKFLEVTVDRRGDELTAVLNYSEDLIGNPLLPALHGGAIAAFLEITSVVELTWSVLWPQLEAGDLDPENMATPRVPKTIDFTVDYLRSGLPRDAYARARVNRSGRRYASVHVEAWQDNRARLFAQATGHFLMPPRDER